MLPSSQFSKMTHRILETDGLINKKFQT